jgi:hypothetical protein
MKNTIWVIEYNPNTKLKTGWCPAIANPDWIRKTAVRAADARAAETGKPRTNYRVREYVSRA